MLLSPPPNENYPHPKPVVGLAADGSTLLIKAIKDDELRLLMYELGFSWNKLEKAWTRVLDACSGPPIDRMAEVAVTLLSAHFMVEVADEVVSKITGRSWEPECKRWVNVTQKGDEFAIRWERNGGIYHQIKRLPGAKYRDSRVFVPAASYEYVEDFAEANGFRFTEAAKNLVEAQKKATTAALVLSLDLLSPIPPTLCRRQEK